MISNLFINISYIKTVFFYSIGSFFVVFVSGDHLHLTCFCLDKWEPSFPKKRIFSWEKIHTNFICSYFFQSSKWIYFDPIKPPIFHINFSFIDTVGRWGAFSAKKIRTSWREWGGNILWNSLGMRLCENLHALIFNENIRGKSSFSLNILILWGHSGLKKNV